MELTRPQDLFSLSPGDKVAKRNLFDLIQYSKVSGSPYWGGEEAMIGNTPQQGINWVGGPPACRAVILKTRSGSYAEDGWADESRTGYHYSFKARGGEISYTEKANSVLIKQPQFGYPVLLFTENDDSWLYEGSFSVSEIEDRHVVLVKRHDSAAGENLSQNEAIFQEGGRKYVTHLMVERSKAVVQALKDNSTSACEICGLRFAERYGVDCIEAHHKVPISSYTSKHVVKLDDLALLCPSCHRAVHIYMKVHDLDYPTIQQKLRDR